MHLRAAPAVLALLLLPSLLPAVGAQAAPGSVPPFTVGADRLFAHASADDLSVWMNTLTSDGAEAPYYLFGAGTDAVAASVDPVANQKFEARIPLTPALTQALLLDGTVNVQAYIGGGSFTAGVADIATSLAVDGKEVGTGASQQHVMSPKQSGTTYDPISWSFKVASLAVPAGAKLEWVLSGTAQAGNNIYLSTYAARGASYIELPVAAASPAPASGAVTHFYRTLTGQNATLQFTSANATNESFRYNWTTGPATLVAALHGSIANGTAQVRVVESGKVLLNTTAKRGAANSTQTLAGSQGNWTVYVDLRNFTGTLTLALAPPAPTAASTPGAPTAAPGLGTTTATPRSTVATTSASTSGTSKTPGVEAPLLLVALAAVVLAARRRLA